ncbi:H(+)/Cl(-) exchange transporter 7-like isoform X2 [Homalodisca vitripennis]|nr:H(+)/Cl(-) exchange transporter 7-like isoform X2 [Homalodisca vitripennis]
MVWRPRQSVLSSPSSFFYVSEKYESLNYIKILNKLEVEHEKTLTFHSLMMEDCVRICYFILAGILTGLVGVFVEGGILVVGRAKYSFLSQYISEHFRGDLPEFTVMAVVWSLFTIVPIMIGSALVVFIAPYAAGGGVAQCVAYMNGVRVPKVLSIKGLWVKSLSTICCVTSGLAGGKEGPMMHLGAIAGGSLPSALPWPSFKSDHERRDLAAAGFGAGIAVAFGAPIGGLLLSVEEGVSFWDLSLMWRSYLCILFAYFMGNLMLSLIEGQPGDFNNPDLLTFGKISSDVTEYELFEIFLFAMVGAIGGMSGALLIRLHVYITMFRKRFVNTKTRKLTESFLVGCLIAAFNLTAVMHIKSCFTWSNEPLDDHSRLEPSQLHCPDGQHSDASVLFLQTQQGIIHSMFSTVPVQISSLSVLAILYFIYINLTMGLTISAGLFVPQVVFGSVWGRIFGITLHHIFPNAQWAHPAKYAYLGAAAQLSGTVGKTFSILVIMVEASGSISFSFPLMVIVSVTKYVENFFVMPIYETQMLMMGLPFLPSKPPPLSENIPTSRVMSNPPLVTFPLRPTVITVVTILQRCKHQGFPVIEKDKDDKDMLLGLILRQQLLVLLKHQAYKYPSPQTFKQMSECLALYLKESRKHLKIEKIEVDPLYYDVEVDLTPYYDPYPYVVQETMPLTKSYDLFRSLGLRHMIVVDEENVVVAMVTRKDLAKYHTWVSMCRMGVKEMRIR